MSSWTHHHDSARYDSHLNSLRQSLRQQSPSDGSAREKRGRERERENNIERDGVVVVLHAAAVHWVATCPTLNLWTKFLLWEESWLLVQFSAGH